MQPQPQLAYVSLLLRLLLLAALIICVVQLKLIGVFLPINPARTAYRASITAPVCPSATPSSKRAAVVADKWVTTLVPLAVAT